MGNDFIQAVPDFAVARRLAIQQESQRCGLSAA
jgi:hypothetical protein